MAGTITPEQLEKLTYIIGPKATSLCSTVVRLHSASSDDKKWLYTGLCGALCFIIDRKLGGVPLFRMYDLNHSSLLFEAQLYCEFEKHYVEINDNFYCFPIPGNHCIGFSFADSDEASIVKSLVYKYSPKNTNMQDKPIAKVRRIATADQNSPKKGNFLTKLFRAKKPKDSDEIGLIDNFKISKPENAIHENHIGWDSKNQTFDLSQLSKELKRVFKKAGIRKKDLKDTNTALLIADAILNQPLPELLSPQKGKKPVENRVGPKKDFDDGTDSRRSSIFNLPLRQVGSQTNIGDGIKKGNFQSSISTIEKKSYNFSKQDEISLTSKLASAIAQRRKQLIKHDVESEEDDWSDDDL